MGPNASSTPLQRPELGDSMEEFDLAADRQGFIGHRVLRPFEAGRQSANVGKIPLKELLRNADTSRAMGAEYKGDDWEFETWSYSTQEYGWKSVVDDRERQLYKHYVDADVYAAERARDVVLRAREIRIARLVFNTTTWTGASLTTALGTPWSTVASADPVADVLAAKIKVRNGCGMLPNALILTWEAFEKICMCTKVIDRLKYSGIDDPKEVTTAMLAALFKLQYIIVAGSMQNTAKKGQTASLSDCWDRTMAMVAKICVTGNIREPGLGRLFHWAEDGSSLDGRFESYRAENNRSDVVRCRTDTDEVIQYAACGHLLTNVLA